jgi:hypothetical protein
MGSVNLIQLISLRLLCQWLKHNMEQKNVPINGWQNIGVMVQYANKYINSKNRGLFIYLVQESFGYCNNKTLHKKQSKWALEYGIALSTFNIQVNELSTDGHININHQKGYVVGGGSKAYSYSPTFPKNIKIWIKGKESEPEIILEESRW